MRRRIVYCAFCLCFLSLFILSPELSANLLQSHDVPLGGSSYPAASGWLAGWQYRKGHDVIGATGAGTNYQVGIKTYYGTVLSASNAADASMPNDGYVAENIVYDSNTSMYWWILEDRSSVPLVIRIAYATSINGTWTVQSTPVINETGHYCMSPCIAQFDSYWYIYYGRAHGNSYEDVDVWVQKSSYINQSYSTSGITNPVLAKGSSGSWDSSRTYEPYIYYENGTYYLFYMGQNGTIGQSADVSNYERVGYATSSSPISGFTKYSGNSILPADNWPHGWDAGSDQAADPFVFKYGDTYYVGVSACSYGHSNSAQMGFYTSKDLATFTHYRGNPVLGYGAAGSWDAQAVVRGAVTNFNGALYLSYAGHYGSDWGCGLTTLTISNTDNGEQVFLNGKCRTDFGDIRFTGSDGTTLLNYWMESEVDGYLASFWVQVAGDLSPANQTIYVYYGNSSATTTSNGKNTFLFFDDFSGGLTKWSTISGTWNVANGDLTTQPTLDYTYLVSANSVGTNNIAIRTRVMSEPAGDIQAHPGIVWHANNLTGTNQKNDQVYFRPHQYGSSDWANIQPAYYSNRILTWHDDKFGSYFAWNTWYTTEVRIPSSGNVTLYGNDAFWYAWGNQQYSYDHIGFVAHTSGQDYWDYILVRKYVNPEPSHGVWGSEEIGKYVIIDQNFVSDERADVSSVQTIGFHAKWNNGSDVVGGSIYVNGTEYVTNSTGWINVRAVARREAPDNFTIIALPDTQFYSASHPEIFDSQTQWVVNNAQSMNIVFVTHEGDIVDDYSSLSQWNNANNSMSKLDGNVQWGILPGNHDLDSNLNPTNYNTYFGYNRFIGNSWYGGAYNNINTNNYELFKGGNDDYLIFHFQYDVNDTVLAWANATLAAYPNRRVIVTTHDYLSSSSRSTIGNRIWNNFVASHADQIFLVLCGHNHGETQRTDIVNGHTVYQIMADYQDRTNGGNGWLRTLEFHPVEDKIYVRTYSPYLNNYETDANSQFTLDYDMTWAASSIVEKVTWIVTGVNCSGVTTYSQIVQNPSIIWDRIKIGDGGTSKGSVMLGEKVTVWFKALYEYDNDTFDGANGVLYVNVSAMSWSTTNNQWQYDYTATAFGTKTFIISGISDSSYNLTVINDNIGAKTLDVWSLPFSVISNSTVSEIAFNSTSRVLSFTVSGPDGTVGYTNVTIAKKLIANISELQVNFDGNQINYTTTSTDYSWLIHFTYGHSTHKVVITLGSPNVESFNETPIGIATVFSVIVIAILTAILLVTKARQHYQSKPINVMKKKISSENYGKSKKSLKWRVTRKNSIHDQLTIRNDQ